MPERVEVLITSQLLEKRLKGNKICEINVLGGQFLKRPLDYLDRVNKRMPIVVESVFSKGKWTYVVFGKWVIKIHLGMSGYWTNVRGERHNHLEVMYKVGDKVGDKVKSLYYNDYRRFGKVNIIKKKNLQRELDRLGYDVLYVTLDEFKSVFKTVGVGYLKVYNFLMDRQDLLAGIGNYLVAEILYRSKVSPHRKIKDITNDELEKIYRSMKRVIRDVMRHSGCSIQDFKGEGGKRQGDYQDYLKVYRQKKDMYGNIVKVEKMSNGRRVHWVSERQK